MPSSRSLPSGAARTTRCQCRPWRGHPGISPNRHPDFSLTQSVVPTRVNRLADTDAIIHRTQPRIPHCGIPLSYPAQCRSRTAARKPDRGLATKVGPGINPGCQLSAVGHGPTADTVNGGIVMRRPLDTARRACRRCCRPPRFGPRAAGNAHSPGVFSLHLIIACRSLFPASSAATAPDPSDEEAEIGLCLAQ
jgi:hypothetical protein